MPILNYTTSIKASKSAGQIQEILVKAKATSVLMDYDDKQNLAAIAFRIVTPHGLLQFYMPANAEGVLKRLKSERGVASRMKVLEHATNVAWRIQKDWVEAQLAKVEAGMAELAEVFLPYVQDNGGKTVYQALKATGFRGIGYSGEAS
jgi:hypothetical protein